MGLFIIYYRSAEDAPKYGSPTPLTHNHLILNISSWQFYLSVDLAHESNSRVFKSPFRYSAQASCNFLGQKQDTYKFLRLHAQSRSLLT